MDDICRVDVEKASEDLINKVLDVLVAQRLAGLDDLTQVCVHQFCCDVHVVELFVCPRPQDIHQSYYLFKK